MQRRGSDAAHKNSQGRSATSGQAVDDYYANPCLELGPWCPEVAENPDVFERYRVATVDLPVRMAAKVAGL